MLLVMVLDIFTISCHANFEKMLVERRFYNKKTWLGKNINFITVAAINKLGTHNNSAPFFALQNLQSTVYICILDIQLPDKMAMDVLKFDWL
jgi:hypothetical protein